MSKILVVDDSKTQRFEFRHDREAANIEVVEAAYESQGWKKVEEMGREVALIIYKARPELKQTGKKVSVRTWMTKPFVGVKLIAVVKTAFGKV